MIIVIERKIGVKLTIHSERMNRVTLINREFL